MAQFAQVGDAEAFALHQQTLEYGKAIISDRYHATGVLDQGPPAWTPYRAHLSEALDYVAAGEPTECIFDGLVVACILDENCGDRTYLDSEIAVLQICNSIKQAPDAGTFMQKRASLLKCWRATQQAGASLVLIQAPGFPHKTMELSEPMHYVVLDHFRVSLIWIEENEDGEWEYMARLEKCDLRSKSWWTPQQPDPPVRREFLGLHTSSMSDICSGCGQSSPRVYKEAILCFNQDCQYFSRDINGRISENARPEGLTFDDNFLLYRQFVNSAQRPSYPLVHDLLGDLNLSTSSPLTNSKLLFRGIVCSRCRSIIPKVYWHTWKCEVCPPDRKTGFVCNQGMVDLKAIVPRTFVSYHGHPPLTFDVSEDFGDAFPRQWKDFYMIDKWKLHGSCFITVLSPTKTFNEHESGPNMIFTNILQDANTGALRLHRYKEQEPSTLDDHFQSNWGAEYAFNGFQHSLPLHQAPPSVSVARRLLDEVGCNELRNSSDSNAVQVFGFMQDMRLQWHVDGEGELGECVSMLNLGGDTVFKLRLQAKHYTHEHSFEPNGEVVRGSKNWQKASKIKEMSDHGVQPNRGDLFEFSPEQPNPAQPEAQIPLIHGSIIIMQGNLFNEYYEHSLTPTGPLTFGVVTRTVNERLHQELLNTRYSVNSERPNGQLFTNDPDDADAVERSLSPPQRAPIPIVVNHVRPRPAPVQKLAYPPRPHRRSPSAESGGSSASGNSIRTQEMQDRLDRLLYLKDNTNLTYEQIAEQEGWADWNTTAMSSALKREKDRLRDEGTYTSPTPSASSSSRNRKPPRAAFQASGSGSTWTQEELEELWELRSRVPPMEYEAIARQNGYKRTAKAYREQLVLQKKKRGNGPMTSGRQTPQQRRVTLNARRASAAQRGQTPQQQMPDIPPVPPLPNAVFMQQANPYTEASQSVPAPATEEDEQLPVRRTRGSGQRSG